MPVNNNLLQRRLRELSSFFGVPGMAQGPEERPPGDFISPEYAAQIQKVMESEQPKQAEYVSPQDRLQAPTPRMIAPSEAEQKYADLVYNKPTMEQYAHPGKLNRIAAIAAGLSSGIQQGGGAGYQAARNIRLAPYTEAMSDWQQRVKALEPVINLEQSRTAQQARLYGTDVGLYSTQLKDLRYEELNSLKRQAQLDLQGWRNQQLQEKDTARQHALDLQIQKAQDRINQIDRVQAGREKIAGTQAKSRESIAEANRRAAMERARFQEGARTARTKMGITSREKAAGSDLPFLKERMGDYELQEAMRLTRTRSDWAEFIKYNDDGVAIGIADIENVPSKKQSEFKKFADLLAARTRRPLNIEKVED